MSRRVYRSCVNLRYMIRAVIALCTICAVFLGSAGRAHAGSEFATSFRSEYVVSGTADTRVTHTVKITNKLAHIYTTQYTITIGSSKIADLEITADGKEAQYTEDSAGGITTLTITIPRPVIGKDQTLTLQIGYTAADLVEHYGKVWEVNIPRLARANEADEYTRRIIVPENFGHPAVEYPHPTTVSSDDSGSAIYEYNGYPSESISLYFGNHVTYKLDLTYEISNPTLTEAKTEIALPPDTEYQKILLDKIEPSPLSIKIDSDGNWLALYSLRAQETETIAVTAYATVYPYSYYPPLTEVYDKLVAPSKYWEVRDRSIAHLAGNLKTPQNIYAYLVENLSYDSSRIAARAERAGAKKALAEPTSAICTEFTDLFVALSRAAGVPAREIQGYAYPADTTLRPAGFAEDILHAWPEYYDSEKSTWVQVDPTWGRTTGGMDYLHKMDYGHIAFVRHGNESTYPHPAGSYKKSAETRTVSVSVVDAAPTEERKTAVERKGDTYSVTNTGNIALRDYRVELPDKSSVTLNYLPPMGTRDVIDEKKKVPFWHKMSEFFRTLAAPVIHWVYEISNS